MDPPSQNSQKRFDPPLETKRSRLRGDPNSMFLNPKLVTFVSLNKKTDNAVGLDSKRDDNPTHNARSNSRPAIANGTLEALNMITKTDEKDRHERLEILKANQEILKTNQEILKAQAEARKQRGEVMDKVLRGAPRDQNKGN